MDALLNSGSIIDVRQSFLWVFECFENNAANVLEKHGKSSQIVFTVIYENHFRWVKTSRQAFHNAYSKTSLDLKKRAISFCAETSLSEACTTLRDLSFPKSPRMVPLGATEGWPAQVRLPVEPRWKERFFDSVRRLCRDGVDVALADLFLRATLAIMGVLTIGAIAGFSYAMNRHRANQIIHDARIGYMDEYGSDNTHPEWTAVKFNPESGNAMFVKRDKLGRIYVRVNAVGKDVC